MRVWAQVVTPAHMDRLGAWLEEVRTKPGCMSLLVPASESLPEIGLAKGSVGVFSLDAIDGTPVDIYNRVCGVYKTKSPHWSQVLWCGLDTTQVRSRVFMWCLCG